MFYLMSEGAVIYRSENPPKDFTPPAVGTLFTFEHITEDGWIGVITGVVVSVNTRLNLTASLFEEKISLDQLRITRISSQSPTV